MLRADFRYVVLVVFGIVLGNHAMGQPLSEHGIHYDKPATVWDEAMPLGNGLLGALVWGDGKPLRISLDRTDLWDLRPVPEFHTAEYSYKMMRQWVQERRLKDLHRLYDDPYGNPGPTKIPAGRIELTFGDNTTFQSASLDLARALTTVSLNDGSRVCVFVHASEPFGMIQADTSGPVSVRLLAPPFAGKVTDEAGPGKISAGDLASLRYKPPVESSGDDWKCYLQEGWGGFRFAAAVVWRKSQNAWLGVWSISTSNESGDPSNTALANCRKALQAGFDESLSTHQRWWDSYWGRSSVRVPNPIIERQWYLEMYKFGSAARADTPPITLQGPWTADNMKIPPWKGDYHHDLNTELSYWPAYSGNQLDGARGYVNWLWNTRQTARAWTKRFFDLPGLNVPMTADLNQEQIGGWHQYTHSATTAAWLAHHFYMQWRYSMDRDFLVSRAWPWLRETCIFLEAITEKGSDGKRTLALSSSPEINDNRLEAWFPTITNYDLALIRWVFEKTAELALEAGEPDEAQRWKQALGEMPELAVDPNSKKMLVTKDYPLPFSHRHFSHLMAIHPLGLIRWENGADDQAIIKASLADLDEKGTSQWCGYSFSWLASLAARARDGDKAARALEIFSTAFCLRNGFHCNGDQSGKGYSNFRYRPFTLEGNFAAAAGLNEMLLQSYSGVIRVFPAIPMSWKDVSFKTLRAEGAFLVSAVRRGGLIQSVEINSEKGGLCRLENPFGQAGFEIEGIPRDTIGRDGNDLLIKTTPGQTITLTAKSASVNIRISPNASYTEGAAAAELAHFLGRLYPDTRFEIIFGQVIAPDREILVGCAESFPELEIYLAGKKPDGPESYVVTTAQVGSRTIGIIFGADARGATYGVYRLLEKLGCGFYLSCDTLPPEQRDKFSFDGWGLSDAPLVRDRFVFNWHNFLSGCSTWNLADWQQWIVQAQKMGYNGVMVHAYGNNPMVKFSFNGVDKPLGYLSTTQKGRDWSTQHVNDVRRLWGGYVFDGSVFGAEAAMVPDSERAKAAERLMHDVFACAEQRDIDVYFAVDVDTESANPQAVIETLPPEARFAIGVESMGWMNQRDGKMWLANPDTPEGYRYYKAQVEALLNAYPQIDCLAVWFRHDNTPWMAIKVEEMPEPWRKQYQSELEKTPEAAKLWKSHNFFALSKVVMAFERALKEIGRSDVRLAVGSWRFDFLPGCDRFLPAHIPFIPLDWEVLNDRSQLRDEKSMKEIARVGAHRPILPVVWAHHDDGNYVGRPYTPYSDFYSRLVESRASGFGIIHWTTRPLDLYFKSQIEQVWRTTENRPLRQTCSDVAARWFGAEARDKMSEYLYLWVTEAPKIGRETSDYFVDRKLGDVAGVLAGYEKRMKLIEEVDESVLTPAEKDRLSYFKGLERFILDVHKTEDAFQRSRDLYKAGDLAGARRALSECRPEQVIERYAQFSSLGGITRGEQGLVASMNLRWLTHYVRHRQALGFEPVRYNFAPTSHDPLAQSMGTFTFHFDSGKNVWECLGAKETGAETFVVPASENIVRGEDVPVAFEEICHSGIESDKPITITMQPIMAKGGRGQANAIVLPAGKYRLMLLMFGSATQRRSFDVQIGAGQAAISDRIEIAAQAVGAGSILMRNYPVELQHSGRVEVVLKPIVGKVILCGAVLEPLSEDDNMK